MKKAGFAGILQKAAIAASMAVVPPLAVLAETPLEAPLTRFANFETGNILPKDTWAIQAGSHQTDLNTGVGTGSQLYYGAADWALGHNLQLGFTTQVIEDPLIKPVLGTSPPTRFLTTGGSLKYRFVDRPNLQVSAQASVESLRFRTSRFGTGVANADNVIGSLHLPVSLRLGQQLQFHLTPGVSVFPETLNGIPFFGTVAHLGVGATWQPNNRLQAFAAVNAPFTGGNTFDATRAIIRVPVYTVGARYAFTPKVTLEGYVTNGVGISPATGILAFYPDGDTPMYGLRVTYTPGARLRDTYRPTPLAETSARAMQLQRDGFTVGSAGVLDPGYLRFAASGGSHDNYAVAGALGLDRDLQIEGIIEDFSNDGTLAWADDPTPNSARWMAGGRIRVLDQNNGDAFSLSGRVLGGRDIETLDVGVLYVAVPASYSVSDRVTLHAEPKFTAFGSIEIVGLGLGLNVELVDGLQALAEVTPVSGGRDLVWAVGGRYDLPGAGLSVDLSATNAIGRYGMGTMVAQDEPRFALSITKEFGIFAR